MRKNVIYLFLVLLFLIVEFVAAAKTNSTIDSTVTAPVTETETSLISTEAETATISTKTKTKSTASPTKTKTKSKDNEDDEAEDDTEKEIPYIPIAKSYAIVEVGEFYADIHCLFSREKQCEIFKEQLKNILKKINKVFEIKSKVTMSLFLMDLTYMCKDCLGIVLPPSYVYLKEEGSDKVYSYPQALAKQLEFDGKDDLELADMDFTMVINVDQDDDDIKVFGEFALAREILHGMGITTTGDLANYNGYENLFMEDFYAPQRHPEIKVNATEVDGVYVQFKKYYPISIYEKYIVTQANPNDYIFENLTDMYKVEYPKQDYYKFMNDTQELDKAYLKESYQQFITSSFYEPAKRIAQLYKQKNSVGFKAADGSVIPLQTFNGEYYKSVSINHIDIPKMSTYSFYDYDPFNKNEIKNYLNEDFILNYTYMFMYDLKTIKESVGKDNKYGIIGPGVVKILTTLGWELKDDKNKDDPKKSSNLKYVLATEVDIPINNYYDELMRVSDEHDYYGYGSLASSNMVCDVKAYALTLLAIGLALGL